MGFEDLKKIVKKEPTQKKQEKKKVFNNHFSQWFLSEEEKDAIEILSTLNTFNFKLGEQVLDIYYENAKALLETLIAHTAVKQSDEFLYIDESLKDITNTTKEEREDILEVIDTYITENNLLEEPFDYLPILQGRESLQLTITEEENTLNTLLEIYTDDSNDEFVQEGVSYQIENFARSIDDSSKLSLNRGKALYIYTKESLKNVNRNNKDLLKKHIENLEKIAFIDANEFFVADAAKEAGINYRKYLKDNSKSKFLHQRAIKLSDPNYPIVAAFSHLELGKLKKDKEHLQKSLDLGIELNRKDTQAMAHLELGKLKKDKEHLQKSLDLGIELNNKVQQAMAHLELGKLKKDKEHLQKSLDLGIELNNKVQQAMAHLELGKLKKDKEHLQKSLDLGIELNNKVQQAMAHLELGKLKKDKEHLQKSLDLGIELNRKDTQAMAHLELGKLKKDKEHLQKSLDLGIELNNKVQQAMAHLELGKLKKDKEHLQKSLDLGIELNNKVQQAMAHLELGKLKKDKEHLQKSLDLRLITKDKIGEAMAHLELGKLKKDKEHLQKSLDLGIELNNKVQQAMAHLELGDLESNLSKTQALFHYQKSLEIEESLQKNNQSIIETIQKRIEKIKGR